jgi:hypothetical protein
VEEAFCMGGAVGDDEAILLREASPMLRSSILAEWVKEMYSLRGLMSTIVLMSRF